MEFKLGELESLFYDIQNIIDYIENSNFEQRRFSMFLSNGEILNYKLFNDHVPHLLGIDTDALVTTGLFKRKSSFELLKEMLSNPYKIHKMVNDGIIRYENIFSDYIVDKIKVFVSNSTPNIYETEFVCKYEPSRAYATSSITAKYDYILVKKIKNTENYACLCFVNNGKYYGAMSSMFFETKEDMDEYLKQHVNNQEITILNGVKSVGDFGEYNRRFNLKPDYVLSKLEKLEEYRDLFKCIINTNKGYIFSLKETLKHMDKHYDDNSLMYDLSESIKEGKLIDRDKFIGSYLINIVDSYNELLCSGLKSIQVAESYTDMQKALKEFKEEITKLTSELGIVKKEREQYKIQYEQEKEENEVHKNNNESILRNAESIIKTLKPNE